MYEEGGTNQCDCPSVALAYDVKFETAENFV